MLNLRKDKCICTCHDIYKCVCNLFYRVETSEISIIELAKEQVVSARGIHGRDLLANGHPTAQHEQGALVFFCYTLETTSK